MIKKVTPTGNLDQENDIPFIKDGDYRDALDVTSISDSNGNTISWEPKTQNTSAFNLGAGVQAAASWSIDFTNVTTTSGSPITINVYRPGGILVNGYVLYIDSTYSGNIPSILATILDLSIKGQKPTTVLSVTNTSGGLSDVTYQITAPNGGNSFRIGQLVNTTGFTGTGYNVTKAVVTAVTATTFTVRVATPSGGAGTGYCIGAEDGSVVSAIDVSNANKVSYTFQTSYPWDFYITCADSRVILRKEADPIDASMVGPFKMCGGQDLLGDLFIMSTTSTEEASELKITFADSSSGAPSGLTITTDRAHGIQVNETVYIYGVLAGGNTIQNEWLVGSIYESSVGSGIYDSFTVYGGEFDLFAAGLNNYIISGTITLSSSAKVIKKPKTLSRISVATENKDSGLISCTHLLTTSSLNFRLHNRIHLHCEDEGFRKSFYWCDGLNKDRVMYYTRTGYAAGGFLDINGGAYSLHELSSSTTLSIRQENISFSLSSVSDSGGSLKSGNYRYAIRFLNKFFSASEWSDLINIVNIYSTSFSTVRAIIGDQDGTATTKSVFLNVSNVPSIYDYYEIAYIRYNNSSYESGAFRGAVTSSSFSVQHTGREVSVDFNPDELNQQNSFYQTSESISVLDNRLIRSNLTSEKQYDFTNFFKSWKHAIARKTKTSATKSLSEPWDNEKFSEYRDPMNVHNEKTFMPYETYRFSARVKLKGGSVVNQNFWIDDIIIDGNYLSNLGNVYSDNRRSNTSLSSNSLEFTDPSRNPYVYYVRFVDINWQYEISGSPVKDLIDCVYIDYVEMTNEYKEILTSGTIVMPMSTTSTISQGTESGSIVYGRMSSGNSYLGPFTGYYTDSVWTGRQKARYSPGLLNNRLTDNNGTLPTSWLVSSATYTAPPTAGASGFFTTTLGANNIITQNFTGPTIGYIDQLNLWAIIKITNRAFSSTAAVNGTNIDFTVAAGHPFVIGSVVIAAGFGGANYNGTYTVTAVAGNVVTVAYSGVPSGSPGTGSLRFSTFSYTGNPIKHEKAAGVFTNFSFSASLTGGAGSYGQEGYYACAITGSLSSYFKVTTDNTLTSQICITDIYLMERGTSTTLSDAYSALVRYESVTDTFQNYKKNAFFISADIYHNQQSISYLQGDKVIAYPLVGSKTYDITTIGQQGGNGGCAFESVYQEYAYSVPAATGGCSPFTVNISDAKAIQPYEYEKIDTQNLANSTLLSITSSGSTKEEYYSAPKCIGLAFQTKIFDQIVHDSGLGYGYYYRPKGYGAKFQAITDSKYVYSGYSKSSFTTNSIDVYGDIFIQNSFFKLRTRKGLSNGAHTYANFGWGYGLGAYSFNIGNYQMEYKYSSTATRITDSATAWLESTEILFGLYTAGYSNRFEIKSTSAYDPQTQTGNRFPTRICYSDAKQNGSFSDDYRVFPLLNFRDLDLSDGEIVHHDVGNGNLYTWQPRSFQQQFFNGYTFIPSSDGSDVIVGDAGALSRRGAQISSIGTYHKWSVIKGKSRGGDDMFAWVNTETGDFARYGRDGTVPISQVQSMMSSLRDKIKWADKKYTPSHDLGINGVWDDTNKSFHFVSRGVRNTHGIWNSNTTYVAPATGDLYVYLYIGTSITPKVYKLIKGLTSTNQNPTTNPSVWQEVFDYSIFNIDYSMIKGGFQSFHSWCPKTMLQWGRTFVSARPGYQESDIFIHNRGGTQYAYPGGGQIATNPYITPVCVLDPNMKTTYEAIELNSSALPSRIDFTTDQHISYLLSSDFEQDEVHDNLWAAPIKNDSTVDANNPTGSNEIDTSNLFGKHLFVKYTFPSASKSKLFNFIIKLTPMSRLNNS